MQPTPDGVWVGDWWGAKLQLVHAQAAGLTHDTDLFIHSCLSPQYPAAAMTPSTFQPLTICWMRCQLLNICLLLLLLHLARVCCWLLRVL